MKAAPVLSAIERLGFHEQMLVHTGQHYDANMSEVFFNQLGIPEPDINLEIGSGSHAVQTAQTMIRLEEVLLARRPDLVLVYGDVNSTIAAALVCAKLGIRVGHVEAGLRSFDRAMPEEINRLLTDQLADLLFTPSADGDENLLREGIAPEKIHMVGNAMIDTLVRLLPAAEERWPAVRAALGIRDDEADYVLVTLHRPSNVDDPEWLRTILDNLDELAGRTQIIFPMHPRTRQRVRDAAWIERNQNLHLTAPLGYLDFMALQRNAAAVITDSGGIQEETTYLGVPCLTLRENTERPVTVQMGTNILIGRDMGLLRVATERALRNGARPGPPPRLWDGHAGERIAAVLGSYV